MTDDLLGETGTARTIELKPDGSGPNVATLVRLPAERNTRGAALLLHGFADYFFPSPLTDHLRAHGFDVYGLDLRGYGRSLRPHQLPNYVTDLTAYFEELDEAARLIHQEDGHGRLVVVGHSTGGLITSLWAHERRADPPLDALVLNSPWLDLAESWLNRTVVSRLVRGISHVAPKLVVRGGLGEVYGRGLHTSHHGEWDYDLTWKPLNGFPVRAGWLATIRRGHGRVRRGLDISVPVLVLHAGRSLLHGKEWTPESMKADTVLDVVQIARWAPGLGRQVAVEAVPDGIHEVFLSPQPAREHALATLDKWLDAQVPATAAEQE